MIIEISDRLHLDVLSFHWQYIAYIFLWGVCLVFLMFTFVFAYFYERKAKSSWVLDVKPRYILLRLLFCILSFYVTFTLLVFAFDTIMMEKFNFFTQILGTRELCLFYKRGWITFLAYIISTIIFSVPLATICGHTKMIVDFSFTIFLVHFTVVSICMLAFPYQLPFWISAVVGFALNSTLAEMIIYRFETMAFRSAMAGETRKQSIHRRKLEFRERKKMDKLLKKGELVPKAPAVRMDVGSSENLDVNIVGDDIEVDVHDEVGKEQYDETNEVLQRASVKKALTEMREVDKSSETPPDNTQDTARDEEGAPERVIDIPKTPVVLNIMADDGTPIRPSVAQAEISSTPKASGVSAGAAEEHVDGSEGSLDSSGISIGDDISFSSDDGTNDFPNADGSNWSRIISIEHD